MQRLLGRKICLSLMMCLWIYNKLKRIYYFMRIFKNLIHYHNSHLKGFIDDVMVT